MGSCPHREVVVGVLGWCHHLGDRDRGCGLEVAEVRFGGWGPSTGYDVEDTMKKGMTPEAVEQMGTQITEAGEQVQQIFTAVQGRVTEFDWTGEDRDRYIQEFESTVGQLVQQVQQQAQEFGDRARNNANQQRDASA